jgi:hypothetical protein
MLFLTGTDEIIRSLAMRMHARETETIAGVSICEAEIEASELAFVIPGDKELATDPWTKIVAAYKPTRVLYLGRALPLVPYVQQGDLIAATQIVHLATPDELLYDNENSTIQKSLCDRRQTLRLEKAYWTAFTGRPDRPQLVTGTIIESPFPITDLKIIAQLQRDLGAVGQIVEGDCRGCLFPSGKIPGAALFCAREDEESCDPESQVDKIAVILKEYLRVTSVASPQTAHHQY